MIKLNDIIRLAESQVGYTEEPPGSNCTKYNIAYYGYNQPAAWCAIWCWWLCNELGEPDEYCDGLRFACCDDVQDWADAHGLLTQTPHVGDWVLFDWDNSGDADHIGIVTSIGDGYIETIEGNTGPNQDAVMRRTRSECILGYVRTYFDNDTEDEDMNLYNELPEIEYGDTLKFSADAIFGDANYEYRVKGTEEWTDETPVYPGTYEIRAYAMTSFGTRRYGDVHTFTIKPRELTLNVEKTSVQYGDMPAVTGNTVNGDTISSCSVIFDRITTGSFTVKAHADRDTLVILDKDGKDVTSCYTVASTPDSDVTLTTRPLEITVETLTREYNGQPFTFNGYEISGGELFGADSMQAVFETKNDSGDINWLINVGNITSIGPTLTIIDGNGDDVTHLYEVTTVAGTLTVEQRPLVIQTNNGELTYSGVEQNYLEYQLMDDFLLEGHTVQVIEEKAAKFLDCNEYENSLSFVILDADGNDVSSNYSINVGYGRVTVKPRKVTVTTLGTGENPFKYNGQDHELLDFTVENATEVDDCEVVQWVTVLDAGVYENVMKVAFFRDDTEDVSDNYEIEYVFGELEVVPREISLKLTDVSREYDGTTLMSDRYEYVNDSLELVTGHTLTLRTTDESCITLPDPENGTATVENKYEDGTARVTDGNGVDVTANYVITVESGILSVEKRGLTLKPMDKSHVYNGEYLNGDYEIVGTAPVEGHELTVTLTDEDFALIVDNAAYMYGIANVLVRDADGNDVTAYYDIDHSGTGKLRITPRPLYLKTPSASKVYDGTPLTAPGFIVLDMGEGTGLVDGDVLESQNENWGTLPAITNVWEGDNWRSGSDGTIPNKQVAVVTNGGYDWTFNYDIHYCKDENDKDEDDTPVYGTLTITLRPITLATDTLEKMYDGTPLFAESAFIPTAGKLVDGQWIENTSASNGALPGFTNVFDANNGVAGNNVQTAAVFADGMDVTRNYKITYEYGTLTVTKRPIMLKTETITREYDGTALNAYAGENYSATGLLYEDILESGKYFGLVGNPYLSVSGNMPSVTNVLDGPIDNTLRFKIYDAYDWTDLTENYDPKYVYGKLSVTPRPITLVSVSGEWDYDGNTHTVSDSTEYMNNLVNGQPSAFYVKDGSIVSNQRLGYVAYDVPAITDVGEIQNLLQVTITDASGMRDLRGNYKITYESYGTLTVNPRHITVSLPDAHWVYDGVAHTVGTATDLSIGYNGVGLASDSPYFSLVQGHRLSVPGLSITDAGIYANEQTVTILDTLGNPVKEGNYVIDRCDYGTITVDKRPLTIQLFGNKIYDGQPVTEFEFRMLDGTSHCAFHTLEVSALEDDIIDAGSWYVNPDIDNLIIRDETKNDVTKNYLLSGRVGEYVVDPRPITIRTDSASKLYDGTPLTAPGFTVVKDYGGMDLVSGHEISLDVVGSATQPGYYENIADMESFRIFDAAGRNVTSNYCAAENSTAGIVAHGKLAISVDVTIRVTTVSAVKVYDGKPLTASTEDDYDWDILSGELPDNFKVIVTVTGSQFGVGSSKNWATVKVVDVNNGRVDVTDLVFDNSGDIEYVYGTLTVEEPSDDREILVLTPIYRSKKYDGTPLDYSDLPWNEKLVITEELQALLDAGYTWDVVIGGSILRAGQTPSYVMGETFVLYDPEGKDVTGNYVLDTQNNGILQIFAGEPIRIYLYSLDVIYDGKCPEWTWEDYVVMYGEDESAEPDVNETYVYYEFYAADNEFVQVWIYGIQAPAANCRVWTVSQMNEKFSSCISYEVRVNGDVADFESVPLEFVMFEDEQTGYALSIMQAALEITADSATSEYDAEKQPSLSSDQYHISKGALAEGHRVLYANIYGEQIGIGKSKNVIEYVIIVDDNGYDVTNNYAITYVNGWLELTK